MFIKKRLVYDPNPLSAKKSKGSFVVQKVKVTLFPCMIYHTSGT